MRRGVLVGVAAGLLLCRPSVAGVRVDAAAPFAADELTAALAVRGGPPDVVVVIAEIDVVRVEVDGRTFRVALGGARGPVAARIVAAHLADLRALPPPPPPPVSAARPHLEVSAGAGISGGAQSRDLTSLRAGVDLRGGRAWQWMLGAAWTRGAADPVAASDLVIARTGLAVASDRFDVATGPLVGHYRIDDGAAAGWTAGWHGGLRVRAVESGRWRLHATLDGEWLQHRVVVRLDGAPVAATPRVALSAGLSIGWELGL
jgi:hypothetical protein